MQLTNKKILVTGGAGFIGSHLVDRLIKLNCQVIVLDDLSNGNIHNLDLSKRKGKLTFIRGSVEDAKLIDQLVINQKCEIIFHLASDNLLRSIEDPQHDFLVNGIGTLNILVSINKSIIDPILVFSSTGSVYGEPQYQPQDEDHPLRPVSPYGISKLAAEKYVLLWHQLYKLRTVALRYYNVYGPRQHFGPKGGVVGIFINNVRHNRPPIIEGTGKQERCFTYVADVVEANILAATQKKTWGHAINIGTTEITTINDLAKKILKTYSSNLKLIYSFKRIGDIEQFRPDISWAKKLLGYVPQINLDEGIKKTVAWFAHQSS